MAHFLVIESWLRLAGSTSGALPRQLRGSGHRFALATRNPGLYQTMQDADGKQHPVLSLAERVVEVDTNDIAALCERMRILHAADPFDAVVTGCDFYLEAVSHVARALGLPGNDPRAVHLAYNKHLLREAQQRAGIPVPHFLATASLGAAEKFARSAGYPMVVKPVDLGGSELVRRVDDAEQLARAFQAALEQRTNSRGQARVPLVLLEELMLGEEVSVETVTIAGETCVIGVTGKTVSGAPAFIETLHMFPARLGAEERAAVEQAAVSSLRAIGYSHGLAHTEIKLTPTGPRVVEVNPRMAGGHIPRIIELTTGVDLFDLTLRLARGQALTEVPEAEGSAAVAYLLPPSSGRLEAIEGMGKLLDDPAVVEFELRGQPGVQLQRCGDNDDRIGHFIVRDACGLGARALAEERLSLVQVLMSA
jgi:biotin carboxylase